jgi:biotin carboxyl carrier protein
MPGRVVKLLARAGDQLKAGQGVLVVEAMKMENEIKVPRDGRLRELQAVEGAAVDAGEVLAVLE